MLTDIRNTCAKKVNMVIPLTHHKSFTMLSDKTDC